MKQNLSMIRRFSTMFRWIPMIGYSQLWCYSIVITFIMIYFRVLPVNWQVPFKHAQHISLSNQSLIIYRAIIDVDHNDSSIRILAFHQCHSNRSFKILIQSQLLSTRIQSIDDGTCPWHWAPGCKWSSYMLSTTIPSSITINDIQLIDDQHQSISIPIDVIVNRHRIKFGRLSVCVPPLYWYFDWLQLIIFIELWRIQGATMFHIYVHSVSDNVDRILRQYESDGIVNRIKWTSLPNVNNDTDDDPNRSIYRLGLNLAQNDCIYRTHSQFTALVDIDEYILPNRNRTLIEYLIDTVSINNRSGSFRFIHRRLQLPNRPIGVINWQLMTFDWLMQSVVRSRPVGPTKVVFIANRIEQLSTHRVYRHVKPYVEYRVSPSDAVLLHARNNWQSTSTNRRMSIFINSTSNIIQNRFQQVMHKVFANQTTILLNNRIQLIIGKCLENWKKLQKCKTPIYSCRNQLMHLENWTIDSDNQSAFTVF